MSKSAKILGERIKSVRESRGLTQEQLAEKLNVSRVSVANYEIGRHCPRLDFALDLARVLKISFDELFSDLLIS